MERTVKRTQRGAAAAKAGQTRKTSGARTVTAKAVRPTKAVVKPAAKPVLWTLYALPALALLGACARRSPA